MLPSGDRLVSWETWPGQAGAGAELSSCCLAGTNWITELFVQTQGIHALPVCGWVVLPVFSLVMVIARQQLTNMKRMQVMARIIKITKAA